MVVGGGGFGVMTAGREVESSSRQRRDTGREQEES